MVYFQTTRTAIEKTGFIFGKDYTKLTVYRRNLCLRQGRTSGLCLSEAHGISDQNDLLGASQKSCSPTPR